LNEKRIQEVVKIEKQADEIFSKAVSEAERIPLLAEQETKSLIENGRSQAEKEAKVLIESSQTIDETNRILSDAESKIEHNATLAKRNIERATTYVISRVVGRG
jgi:vacuolar-type H+-ATPase subunit H